MADSEPGQPPEPQPVQPLHPAQPPTPSPKIYKVYIKSFSVWFWDKVGIKSGGDLMVDHASMVESKGKFLAGATIFLLVAFIAGIGIRGCYDSSKVESSNNAAKEQEGFANAFKAQLDTANNQITQLKVDSDEAKREKDVEIQGLKTENASLQNRVASYESAHVMELSSNFDLTLTNMLGKALMPDSADIKLCINGFWIKTNDWENLDETNIPIIPVKYRAIFLTPENFGTITADRVCIDFIPDVYMQDTNFIILPNGWRGPYPSPVESENASGVITTSHIFPHWILEATHSLPPRTPEPALPIFISTNCPYPYVTAIIRVYGDGTKISGYKVGFHFE